MAHITLSEGRICIIKVKEMKTVKDGLEEVKKGLVEFTTSDRTQSIRLDTYILIDLSPFNIINSSLIGIMGSTIMSPTIRLLGLCGVQPPVADILKRFGVITNNHDKPHFANKKITDSLEKVVSFSSVEEALMSLAPD